MLKPYFSKKYLSWNENALTATPGQTIKIIALIVNKQFLVTPLAN
jgi:hypothetical protein